MSITLRSVDRTIGSVAAFRAQQDAVAIGLCSQLDALYAEQIHDRALNQQLRDWGIFAADVDGKIAIIQEPPGWMTSSTLWKPQDDFSAGRKRDTAGVVDDLLDPASTTRFFKHIEGFRGFLAGIIREAPGAKIMLFGSAVNPSAPLFSRRSPYYFNDIDVTFNWPDIATSRNFGDRLVKEHELRRRLEVSETLEIGDHEMSVPIQHIWWVSPYIENSPAIYMDNSENLVPYPTRIRGGGWRSREKYHRYLAEKFMGWAAS